MQREGALPARWRSARIHASKGWFIMERFWEEGSGHARICPRIVNMLRVLSVDVNLEVLDQLATASANVSGLARILDLHEAAISRHLKELHSFSMVSVVQSRQSHIYSLGAGIEVIPNGTTLQVRGSAADGGAVFVDFPRPRRSNGQNH